MARTHGRVDSSAWLHDTDWRRLPMDAQWLYMMLISQPELTAAGTLSLSPRRWAQPTDEQDLARVERALQVLIDRRFVVVDGDTDELLVRSFARRETQWGNSKRVAALGAAWDAIHSPILRNALVSELRRVDGLPNPLVERLPERLPERLADPENSEFICLSSLTVSSKNRDTGDEKRETRLPATGKPSTAVALPERLTETQRSKRITDAYAEAEPMCRWPAINSIVRKAIQTGRWADDEIHAALLRLAAEGRSVTVETLRTELAGVPPGRSRPPSTTDQRVSAALALAARYEQEDR